MGHLLAIGDGIQGLQSGAGSGGGLCLVGLAGPHVQEVLDKICNITTDTWLVAFGWRRFLPRNEEINCLANVQLLFCQVLG